MSIAAMTAITVVTQAQCVLDVTVSDSVIFCGGDVTLDAVGLSPNPALSTDFNGSAIGAGWQTSATLVYNNPCGPSLDGTPSAWFGNVPLPRTLTTNGFDVSCGGQVCFDLDFAADDPCGGCQDCEDPDLTNEGVFFRYSIDNGATWVDIFYFEAISGYNNAYYQWDNYCFTLPPAAWSTNTMFQWDQPSASSNVNDHWGIDNVIITPSNCGYVYDWDNIAGVDDPQNQTITMLDTTTTYVVQYYDTAGVDVCYDTITITVNPLTANTTAANTNLLCAECTDLNTVMVNDPAPAGYTYSWTPSTVSDTAIQAPSICPPEGTSTYYATIVNPVTGCIASDSVVLNTAICSCHFLSLTADSLCQPGQVFDVTGEFSYDYAPTTGVIVVEVTNGSGTYYDTIQQPFQDSTLFPYNVTNIPNDGTTANVTVYFSDSLSCTISTSVLPPPMPTVTSMTGGNTYCQGDAIDDILVEVTGTGPWTIDYTLDGVTMSATGNSSPINLGNTPGVYVLSDIYDVVCVNWATQTDSIIVNPLPTIDAGDDSEICVGTEVILSGSGGINYAWDNGVANGLPFTPTSTMTYTAIGTDANGCQNTDQVTVTVHEYPQAPGVSPDGVEYCWNTEMPPFVATGTGNSTFNWYFDAALTNNIGTGSQLNPYNEIGTPTYYVTQTENGCESDASPVTIIIVGCEGTVDMPNVITLNGDNVNDFFTPIFMENVVSMRTTIVNRWGNVIFETDDINVNWNGQNKNGDEVSEGVYFWKVTFRDLTEVEKEVHGFVEVVK